MARWKIFIEYGEQREFDVLDEKVFETKKQATEFCKSMGCSSVIYDIYDPQDSEHTELTVTDCGYAE